MKLVQADKLEGGRIEDLKYDSFAGDVIFEHEGSNIYCDSAVFYKKENNLEAFGHVRIEDNDSVTVTSRKLTYNGDSKIAQLRGNVVFVKKNQMTLYTNNLDYDLQRELAFYFNGGRIVDSTNELSSDRGYYQVQGNMASFKKNVEGNNPDYTLKADTLQYNTKTKVIYFRDQTELTNVDGDVFVYESGVYDTRADVSDFSKGYVESPSYFLYGDKLQLDDIRKFYTAENSVRLVSKEDEVIVWGDKADYFGEENKVKVYENTLLKMISEGDTLYLSADTLVSIDAEADSAKRIFAYRNVRMFKSDLQAVSDSMVYFQADSILRFYGNPILWTQGNQMSADTIEVIIRNQTVSRLLLRSGAFVISHDTLRYYNQIKGRNMEAVFDDRNLEKVFVYGNSESIFFMMDDDMVTLVGMNKVVCSDMTLTFRDNELFDVVFYQNSEGLFIPPHELKEPDTRLSGFEWLLELQPTFQSTLPVKYFPIYQIQPLVPEVEMEENPKIQIEKGTGK